MPPHKVELTCKNKHPLYHAAYRNSATIKRIPKLLYCPTCNEFYEHTSSQINVRILS